MCAAMVKRFLKEVRIADGVVTYDPDSRVYLIGRIESDPEWTNHEALPRTRKVTWTHRVLRDVLTRSTRFALGSIATFFRTSSEAAEELQQKAVPIDSTTEQAPVGEAKAEGESEGVDLREEFVEKADQFVEDKITGLDWAQLQELVAGILRAMGYRTQVSPAGSDRGVDIFASPDGLGLQEPRVFVEVKHRPGSAVSADDIRSFLGGRRPGDRCLYVGTGGFTKDARYEAERATVPLTLIGMQQLREMLVQYYESLDASTRALVPLQRLYWPIG